MTERIGIIAFSLGLEPDEPSKCNIRVGRSVVKQARREVAKGNYVSIVSQWEPEPLIQEAGFRVDVTIGPLEDGTYLSGDHVLDAAIKHFQRIHVFKVILIVHPLAWFFTKLRAQRAGLKVLWRWPGWIGANIHSSQWQDRSSIFLLIYGAVQVLRGRAIKSKNEGT